MVSFDRGRHWTPVKLCPYGEGHARFGRVTIDSKDSKQHQVMFHELCSVSSLLCIAQNVRFQIPYEVLYFETPFLIIFKYYAWVSCVPRSYAVTCDFDSTPDKRSEGSGDEDVSGL